ncbi:hypothetical protein CEXT_444191, partial [Caerostris extrusa]
MQYWELRRQNERDSSGENKIHFRPPCYTFSTHLVLKIKGSYIYTATCQAGPLNVEFKA